MTQPAPVTDERGLLRSLGALGLSTARVTRGFAPLLRLLASEADVTRDDLAQAVDRAFDGLYAHPILLQTERITQLLRRRRLIPNEQSTEELIRFVVDQAVMRSPVAVPTALVDEFWLFFNELFASPEVKGLGSLTLDMLRLVIRTYEPMLVEIVNLLKAGRRFNQWQRGELLKRAAQVRRDVAIVRRQLRALRFVKLFFQADPKDFAAQAQIVAQMVREFGPFFVKLAQVAAANADFLPEEIARELAVFHEDVPPMNAEEVTQAFLECRGVPPDKLYMGFDAEQPLRSGSIGSIYLAKKPFMENGLEVLRPVIVKVGRHNLDREFVIGKMVLGLAILSSQYWAPHSKLAPFLRALQEQVDEFVAGFVEELDFDVEAQNQERFRRRSRAGGLWRVPDVYSSTPRIIEMEYLASSVSLARAVTRVPERRLRRFQARITRRLLHTVLQQALLFGELHGDLHPGNIMLDEEGTLHLIDWGNVVPLSGKWSAVRDYLAGALLADSAMLTDALIDISTQPELNRERRGEICAALEEILRKKNVTRLTARVLLREWRDEGWAPLHRRAHATLQMLSNTQQAGLVIRKDYLHLSRAVMALIGSFSTLYPPGRKRGLLRDLGAAVITAPLTLGREILLSERDLLRARRGRSLPADPALPAAPAIPALGRS